MSVYVPNEPAEIVIGVCGEQGAGKTIFQTCIFQSIWTAFPDDVVLGFDRKEIGNANYFQSIEDSLLAEGPPPGTVAGSLFPARIYVKPYEPLPGTARSVLSVDLLDFAGRHFRSIADLTDLPADSESDTDAIKALRAVNDTLERADAFVILINSTEIDPINAAPKRNPFSPSVNFMLAHCREERKPVALLFTQIDQTPRLTEELFRSMPRIQAFERHFTADLQEASSPGGRPFGIARRISCYETVPGDLAPKSQSYGGNIWRPEAAQIVLELLRAAMPAIKARREQAILEAEDLDNQKKLEQHKRRTRRMRFGIAAIIAMLITLAGLALAWYKRTEGHQVRLIEGVESQLRNGNITAISAATETSLREILGAQLSSSGGRSSAVVTAIRSLESAFGEVGQRLADQPLLTSAYAQQIARFESLMPLFQPAVSEGWREVLFPLLGPRRDFLSGWDAMARKPRRERTHDLDEAAKRFATTDPPFSNLLTTQSTMEKEREAAAWQTQIEGDADVLTRLATIQRILALTIEENDPELTRLGRKALAAYTVATILKRSENEFLRENLLTPLVPDLAKFGDGEVRFEVLARELLSCSTRAECEQRHAAVQSAIDGANTNSANWGSAVENLLNSLLLDLPVEQRREIWQAVVNALASTSLFSGRPDAWPNDISPLHARIAALAAGETDSTPGMIELLAQRPIYAAELEYLKDRFAATALRRTMVPIYATLLSALSQRDSILPSDQIFQINQALSVALAGRVASGPFAEIAGEINEVSGLVRQVNNLRTRGIFGDAPATARLERVLRDAKRSDCEALVGHEAPAECADAA